MRHYMIYNGVDSRSLGFIVASDTPYTMAERIVESYNVPGRSGAVLQDTGAFANYTQSYEILTPRDEYYGSAGASEALKNWLRNDGKYHELVDSYDSNTYRLARVIGVTEITSNGPVLKRARCMVEFDVCPQRYYSYGHNPVTVHYSETLTNPSQQVAYPIITFHPTDSRSVSLAGKTVTVQASNRIIIYDCDTTDATFADDDTSANGLMVSAPRVGLPPNTGTMVIVDEQVTITPRWWRL